MTRTFSAHLLPLVATLSACSGPTRIVAIGETIHHDDFEYSVRRVETVPAIGGRTATGTFYAVTFQVENRAGRVNHIWTDNIAYVVDAQGRTFEHIATKSLTSAAADAGTPERHVTAAETTESTVLVFDLPADVREPYLKVRGETLMGDVFDGLQFTRARIRLF